MAFDLIQSYEFAAKEQKMRRDAFPEKKDDSLSLIGIRKKPIKTFYNVEKSWVFCYLMS